MCGIYGYIGDKNASEVIVDGLQRLNYRGYDSWGVGIRTAENIQVMKKIGILQDKNGPFPDGRIGIGHTRWATHGAVTDINAHPHSATSGKFTLAQNGIVENYEELKTELRAKGYGFISQTDTEVIVRLIEEQLKTTDTIFTAVREAFLKLKGRNTIILLTTDDEIIAARNGSPLVIGTNAKKEIYLSSDVLSFSPYADQMLVVENGQMVICKKGDVEVFDIKSNKKITAGFEKISIQNSTVHKEGYDHFMIKEIFETPKILKQFTQVAVNTYTPLVEAIKKARTVYTIGSGSAGIAAAQMAFYLREYGGIKTISLIGADAQEYYRLFDAQDVIIAPSQSGETADVLEVLEVARKKNMKIATYVNMPGSMMTRMADFKFMTEAGPEICVMSTKVFTAQIVWGYVLAKLVQGKPEECFDYVNTLVLGMDTYLNTQSNHVILQDLARNLLDKKDIFLLGKYQNFQIMKEGMVKLIEGTYKHAHAIPSGDLKHYAITLMDTGVPVIAAISPDIAEDDVINAVNQVKARGAYVIGISAKPQNTYDWHIPVPDVGEASALFNIIPLQLLAYYLANMLGNNIDKPRNIAKSVTVK